MIHVLWSIMIARRSFRGVCGSLRVGTLALCFALNAPAADWPNYRGPTHNGVATERINKNWSGNVTNPVWTVYLTNGLTSLIVGRGRVFTQVAADTDFNGYADREYCVALSNTNGAMLWATETDSAAFLYPNGGVGSTDDGPRSTPVLLNDSVYVLSSYLKLYRLNVTNGAVIWSTNLAAGFGGGVIQWQNAASPVIENGLIYVNANAPTASLMAFNITNSALVWRAQNEAMTHSTPVPATIHGTRQLVWASQGALVSVSPLTGELIWRSRYPFNYSISIGTSPVIEDDRVFITANYIMSAYAVQITLSDSDQLPVPLWTNAVQRSHWSTPVAHAGHLFGMFYPDNADGQLRCVDLTTGVTRWGTNYFGRSSLLLVGTNLLCLTERGSVVLVAAQTNEYRELGRFQAIPNYHSDTNKCWNGMALSDGQLYVRSTAYAARFDLSVPELQLDPPEIGQANAANLKIRTVNGTAVGTDRLAALELRATTNASLSPSLWPTLNQELMLSNGVVVVTNVDASPSRQFFMVTEPE